MASSKTACSTPPSPVRALGRGKVTIDDIAAEAAVLPGHRSTACFPAARTHSTRPCAQRETREFFAELTAHLAEADGYEDLLVSGRRRGDPARCRPTSTSS